MHILIIPTWYVTPERPDAGIYFREHALALIRAGQKVGVVYVDAGLGDAWLKLKKMRPFGRSFYMDQGLPTLRLDALGFPKRFIWSQRLYAKLVERYYVEYCQKVGMPDIIHAQGYTAGYASSWIKQRWKVPFVYCEHMTNLQNHQYPAAHGHMLLASLREADAITAVSSALASWMQEKTERTIQVIPNLIDTDLFSPDPSKKSQAFTFLYVGDLIPHKAVDLLLHAFSIFLASNVTERARLEIVGTGYLREALEQLAHRLGISQYVRFYGLQPASTVAAKMQEADCFVLSSQIETFGVVLAEAMACGLPIISTDCGGPADIVTRETGILVKTGDVTALAEAMTTMFKQAIYYNPLTIRASAVERFGSEQVTKKWMSLYREVIEFTKK